MSEIIYLSDVRLSFPHLTEPQVQKVTEPGGKDRIAYNADFILPKEHPGLAQFMARYATMAAEKWKENAQAAMQRIHAERKTRCYGTGEEKVDKKFQVYKGYVGMMYISASSDRHPQIIDPDGKPIDPNNTMLYRELTSKMLAGYRVNAAIKPWLQENKHGVGVRSDLVAVQFLRVDEPFGEGVPDVTPFFGVVGTAVGGPLVGAPPAAPMGLPPFMMQK